MAIRGGTQNIDDLGVPRSYSGGSNELAGLYRHEGPSTVRALMVTRQVSYRDLAARVGCEPEAMRAAVNSELLLRLARLELGEEE